MTHALKTWPQYFNAIRSGEKPFEIRKNDRNFAIGDVLRLQEYEPAKGYSGRAVYAKVTYITDFEQQPGYVVMGIKLEP